MRVLLKISIPIEAGNEAARTGKLAEMNRQIIEEQKPEAVYFLPQDGKRTALLFLNLESAADIPRIVEPWFLAFNASVEVTPAFTPEELMPAAADIKKAVERYG